MKFILAFLTVFGIALTNMVFGEVPEKMVKKIHHILSDLAYYWLIRMDRDRNPQKSLKAMFEKSSSWNPAVLNLLSRKCAWKSNIHPRKCAFKTNIHPRKRAWKTNIHPRKCARKNEHTPQKMRLGNEHTPQKMRSENEHTPQKNSSQTRQIRKPNGPPGLFVY